MTTVITSTLGFNIKHGILVNLNINATNYYFGNTYSPVVYQGATYTNLGAFLNIGEIQDDLRATNSSLQVSLSGVPSYILGEPNLIALVLNTPVKGSKITIYRAFFIPGTNTIAQGQVFRRFQGYVSNYTLSESIDQESRTSTNSITLQCSSTHGILERQVSGRRTNPLDFPGDAGMSRVATIADKPFDFGKPYARPASQSAGSTPSGGDVGTPVEDQNATS